MTDERFTDFENPPVFEAVMGVEFNPIPLGAIGLARLYDVWGKQYPDVQELPALPPSAAIAHEVPTAQFVFSQAPPALRLWFTSADSEYVIQVQNDRLILNWRKSNGGKYPRYESLRKRFESIVEEFFGYLVDRDALPLVVSAIEFSYVNRIEAIRGAEEIYTVFRAPSEPLAGSPLFMRFQEVRNLSEVEYSARGQVSISSEPVSDAEGQAISMSVTTKFFPTFVEMSDEVWQLLDTARKVSRDTFVALTTREMQEQWGRL